MTSELAAPAPSTVAVVDPSDFDRARTQVRSNFSAEDFERMVDEAKEAIRAGEVFQVVVSQRFSAPCDADALDVYRALRSSNPSPYMYLLRLPAADGTAYDVVGSSPEALVKVTGRRAITHPIAGSRPRGKSPEDDLQLAEDLLADPKERAEHVTHLESTVVGELRPESTAYDVLVATFPAGTLSGAPKPRAMSLIESFEPSRRGVYGGVVGYLDFHGDLDMAIAIRTAVIKDAVAHVQAGAGIVADSVPTSEYEETVNKAAAALRAVATAAAMRTVR
jgi:anthranilate synthase component 1